MMSVLRTLTLAALLVGTLPADAAWRQVDESWLALWDRCRVAVEHGTEVDHTGLEPSEPRKEVAEGFVKVWNDPSSTFEVYENEPDAGRHICQVSIKDGQWPEDPADLVSIIGTFEQHRQELIEAGDHELRYFDRVAPYAAALGPVHRSPSGCPVISVLMITPEERSLVSFSAEQVAAPCETPATQ